MWVSSVLKITLSCLVLSFVSFVVFGLASLEKYDSPKEGLPDNTFLQNGFIYVCLACVTLIIFSTLNDINRKERKINPVYTAFSLRKNLPIIFSTTKNNDLYSCFDGIRVVFQCLAIIAHFFVIQIFSPEEIYQNWKDLENWKHSPWFYLTFGAHLLSEISFIVSGICLANSFFQQRHKGEPFNLIKFYLKRYLKYTPSFLAAVIVFILIIDMNHYLPFSSTNPITVNHCHQTNWLRTLTYTQKLDFTNYCFGVGWTLDTAMKIYYLSPIILFGLWKYEKPTIIVMLGIILNATYTVYSNIMKANHLKLVDYYNFRPEIANLIYIGLEIRCDSWLVGILFGYFLFKNRDRQFYVSKQLRFSLWCISLVNIAICIFAPYVFIEGSFDVSPIIFSPFRIIMAFSIIWILFDIIKGKATILNWFFSLSIWKLINKHYFSIYLVHISVMLYYRKLQERKLFFDPTQFFVIGFEMYLVTLLIAVPWTLIFEMPFVNLEKELSKRLF